MAHEFKTPLTSIKAATTSLLANPDQPAETKTELVKIADEEAEHLEELIDNAVEMARLDTAHIQVQPEMSRSGRSRSGGGRLDADRDRRSPDRGSRRTDRRPHSPFDRRLVKLAIKQLLDNALKYSPPDTPVTLTNQAATTRLLRWRSPIMAKEFRCQEQSRIFERFYRSPSVSHQIPGSGLGLSIAHRIVQAHNGDLSVTSRPGETTFRLTLPVNPKGERK